MAGTGLRAWLTRRFLDRYLAQRTYLRLADRHDIDNPDERISEDVRTYTATTLSFAIMLVNGVVTLVAFSGVLWSIIPWLFVIALAYAAIGSLGTIVLGRRLVALNHQQLQKEADFRYGLGRVREHAEEVAQIAGEEEQKQLLGGRLDRVVENFRAIIRVSRNLGFFTTAYNYLPQIIPAAVVALLYIRGEVEFGTVTQAAMAFAQVQGAFSLIVTQFQEMTIYAAVIGRLGSLWEASEPMAPAPALRPLPSNAKLDKTPTKLAGSAMARPVVVASPDANRLAYEHLSLWAPDDDRPLVRDLSLELPAGERLAITGPSDVGRRLLLATAGLWTDGQGQICHPGPGKVMFVPNKPQAIKGRLREALCDGLGAESDESLLRKILADLGLAQVIKRHGGIDADRDWQSLLSPHELHALAFARLLLVSPRFAFLEGSVDNQPSPLERNLYETLAKSAISYVSVCCRPFLVVYHDWRLDLHGDGTWRLDRMAHDKHPLSA